MCARVFGGGDKKVTEDNIYNFLTTLYACLLYKTYSKFASICVTVVQISSKGSSEMKVTCPPTLSIMAKCAHNTQCFFFFV